MLGLWTSQHGLSILGHKDLYHSLRGGHGQQWGAWCWMDLDGAFSRYQWTTTTDAVALGTSSSGPKPGAVKTFPISQRKNYSGACDLGILTGAPEHERNPY
jgi:hypothetical protein